MTELRKTLEVLLNDTRFTQLLHGDKMTKHGFRGHPEELRRLTTW